MWGEGVATRDFEGCGVTPLLFHPAWEITLSPLPRLPPFPLRCTRKLPALAQSPGVGLGMVFLVGASENVFPYGQVLLFGGALRITRQESPILTPLHLRNFSRIKIARTCKKTPTTATCTCFRRKTLETFLRSSAVFPPFSLMAQNHYMLALANR